jgi:hypothetical protein
MKLLLCIKCSDVIKLREEEERTCFCGKSGGKYIDELNAEYWGSAYLIGFANSSLVSALRKQIAEGDLNESMGGIYGNEKKGRQFNAFLIPESAPTIKKVDK